jgi:Cof subfamily protein (haloacid dehalogenase superfamily)
MASTIKAIFLDVDGTLINHKGGPFPDDLEAMTEAAKLGHKLFLNTGRSFSNISQHLLQLPIWSGIAAGGGAHVLLKKPRIKRMAYKTIYHEWLSNKTLSEICECFLKSSKTVVLEGETNCYIINPSRRHFFAFPVITVTDKDDFAKLYPDEFITKLTIDGDINRKERDVLDDFFTINTFVNYTEAVIKGEDKAKAMAIILDKIRIKREDSIALGDGINDIDMIRFAGIGIAMGKASDEVKAAAAHVTADCGEGGIAQALKRFVL